MKVCFVNERLAFGSKVRLRRHVEKLRELGITHVISVRYYQSRKLRAFPLLFLSFKDDGKPRPAWFYRRALKFYNRAMNTAGSKVFVMCRGGRRRSPSLTYFLLRSSGIGSRRAERLVFAARPCALIPRGYRDSAEKYLWRKQA